MIMYANLNTISEFHDLEVCSSQISFFRDVIITISKSVCTWVHLTPYSILLNHSVSSSCHLNLQDESGNTALHYAVTENHLDLIKMLLSKGASVVLKNGKNMTPLQCSLEMVSWPLVCFLNILWYIKACPVRFM